MAKTKKVAADVPVQQPAPVQIALKKLQPAPYNPRRISEMSMEALKASLTVHGLLINLVVQKHSEQYGDLVIIGGHQRLRAVREICEARQSPMPELVWCVVLDVDDRTAKRLNIALNNIEGEFDPEKLGHQLAELFPDVNLISASPDVALTGFTVPEITDAIAFVNPPPAGDGDPPSAFGRSITLSLEFSTVELRDRAKQQIVKAAKDKNQKPGDYVLAAVKAVKASKGKK
jgi:hypothetical protein